MFMYSEAFARQAAMFAAILGVVGILVKKVFKMIVPWNMKWSMAMKLGWYYVVLFLSGFATMYVVEWMMMNEFLMMRKQMEYEEKKEEMKQRKRK